MTCACACISRFPERFCREVSESPRRSDAMSMCTLETLEAALALVLEELPRLAGDGDVLPPQQLVLGLHMVRLVA
eukprot:scaffold22087_cov59-Phaeocystis_antarctica.AAC.2